jgi:hypothetical protein
LPGVYAKKEKGKGEKEMNQIVNLGNNLSRRDFFALEAMKILLKAVTCKEISDQDKIAGRHTPESISRLAYSTADAMIEESEKPKVENKK